MDQLTRKLIWILAFCLLPVIGLADDRTVKLFAPAELVETGLIKHVLPRFSLKTGIRVELADAPDGANMVIGPEGRALFQGAGATWHMELITPDHAGTKRFADWLTGDVGMRTITGYAPEGTALFEPPAVQAVEVAAALPSGDAVLGYSVSQTQCGRCHAVDEAGRKNDIGSTPSFFVLRSFEDWEARFAGFYVLKPHAAFTQIKDVTDPFPEDRPSPIVPVELTIEDLEAVMAYVAALTPADLGKPLEHQ